jgi:TPR repeat protein
MTIRECIGRLTAWTLVFVPLLALAQAATSIEEVRQKAEAGDRDAQFRLGSAYDSGAGVPRDGAEAMKWYLRAAEAGHAEAQNSIGSGLQAEKRYEEARTWYERAAAQGHALATNNLAYLHDLGLGVKQDRQKGFELYSRAAELGWAEAMWNLANMYGAGQLGEKDLDMACVWTLRAVRFAKPSERQRFAPAFRAAGFFERQFPAEKLSACKQKSEAWRPSAMATQKDAQQGAVVDAPKAARP